MHVTSECESFHHLSVKRVSLSFVSIEQSKC